MRPALTLADCLAYAKDVGLDVVQKQDRKRGGGYVDVYIVYRLNDKQGKSRSFKGLMKLLRKTPAVKTAQPAEQRAGPAQVLHLPTPATKKPWWWEDD